MSWAGSEHWELYLGATDIGLACGGRNPVWQTHASAVAGLGGCLAQVRRPEGLLRGWRRGRFRVWLSGALARPFVVDLPEGLRNARERQALAEARAGEATGLSGPCIVWLSAKQVQGPMLGVAIDAELRDALFAAASSVSMRVSSIRPWWSQALDTQLMREPGTELFAAEDTESITLLLAKADVWSAADSYVPKASAQQLEPLITRRVFAAGVSPSAASRVRLLQTEAPGATTWPAALSVSSFDQP